MTGEPPRVTGAAHSLPDLAGQIEHEHQLASRDALSALQHALECGRLLIEAKADVGHGGWLDWLKANTSISVRRAQRYMRLATHEAELAKCDGASYFTIDGALAALATQPYGERPALEPPTQTQDDDPENGEELADELADKLADEEHGEEFADELADEPDDTDPEAPGTLPPSRLRDEEGIYTYSPPRRASLSHAPARYVDLETARTQYLQLVQDFGMEHRLRESRVIMKALRLNNWATVQMPQPEPGMKSWDDGAVIGQLTAWFERHVADCRVSPSACQLLAHKLEQIAAEAMKRGWPEPKAVQPPQAGNGLEPRRV